MCVYIYIYTHTSHTYTWTCTCRQEGKQAGRWAGRRTHTDTHGRRQDRDGNMNTNTGERGLCPYIYISLSDILHNYTYVLCMHAWMDACARIPCVNAHCDVKFQDMPTVRLRFALTPTWLDTKEQRPRPQQDLFPQLERRADL